MQSRLLRQRAPKKRRRQRIKWDEWVQIFAEMRDFILLLLEATNTEILQAQLEVYLQLQPEEGV